MTDSLLLPPESLQEPPGEIFLVQEPAGAPRSSPSVKCPAVNFRSWSTWNDVGRAMRLAPTVSFQQGWRSAPEKGFRPAAAALAHDQDDLIIYAELWGDDILNPVREHGVHAYLQGDVFEIFLRAEGQESYFEHHITPENYTLQLTFPSSAAYRGVVRGSGTQWSDRFATTIPVQSRVLVQPARALWRILAVVPLGAIASSRAWRFSLCRYDYQRGKKEPVLSSTSAYKKCDFHDGDAWGHLHI